MVKAEAEVGKGVDEQKDQLIPMSKFSKNCVFSGLEIQKSTLKESVLNAHPHDCKIWPKECKLLPQEEVKF